MPENRFPKRGASPDQLTKSTLLMSKFDEAVAAYKAEMTGSLGMTNVDETLLTAVTKALGPSIYNPDSSKVSCSDQTELDRVKKNFLVGKLGLADGPELDAALKEACEKMGSSNRNKYRAVFHYLLVQKFGKASLFV